MAQLTPPPNTADTPAAGPGDAHPVAVPAAGPGDDAHPDPASATPVPARTVPAGVTPGGGVDLPALLDQLTALTREVARLREAAVPTNRLRDDIPTLDVYIPRVLETASPGTRRTYRSPLRRLAAFRPCLPLDPGQPAAEVGASPDCARLGCTSVGHHQRLGALPLDVIVVSDLQRFAVHVRTAHRRRRSRSSIRRYAPGVRTGG
jgi:hypothetical protein